MPGHCTQLQPVLDKVLVMYQYLLNTFPQQTIRKCSQRNDNLIRIEAAQLFLTVEATRVGYDQTKMQEAGQEIAIVHPNYTTVC